MGTTLDCAIAFPDYWLGTNPIFDPMTQGDDHVLPTLTNITSVLAVFVQTLLKVLRYTDTVHRGTPKTSLKRGNPFLRRPFSPTQIVSYVTGQRCSRMTGVIWLTGLTYRVFSKCSGIVSTFGGRWTSRTETKHTISSSSYIRHGLPLDAAASSPR